MKPRDLHGKKILYGCLDWGSGHVSRSIPLIRQLTEQQNDVIIWCSEKQESIFRQFELKVEYYTGFDTDFVFKGDGNFFLEILRNALRFSQNLRKEKRNTAAFVSQNGIDLIISDHRYGLFSKKVKSVFITHQFKLPKRSGTIAQKAHSYLMGKFDKIWIMDEPENRLAGDLSSSTDRCEYIGHYSRFSEQELPLMKSIKYVAIISGPAEYAKQFYDGIIKIACRNSEKWVIIAPGFITDNSSAVKHVHDWKSADEAIKLAGTIISRCGYSTLMDLQLLNCKALLIPTPGQLEQVYLSEYLSERNEKWQFLNKPEELNNYLI